MPEYPLDDPLLMALREARPLLDDEFDPRQPEAVALRHEIVHNRSPRLTGSVLRPGGSARNRRTMRKSQVLATIAAVVVLMGIAVAVIVNVASPSSAYAAAKAAVAATANSPSGTMTMTVIRAATSVTVNTTEWNGEDVSMSGGDGKSLGGGNLRIVLIGGSAYVQANDEGWEHYADASKLGPTVQFARDNVAGTTADQILGLVSDLTQTHEADGTTLYRGTIANSSADLPLTSTDDAIMRMIRSLRIGNGPGTPGGPHSNLQMQMVVGRDDLVQRLSVTFEQVAPSSTVGSTTWTVQYTKMGSTPSITVPPGAVPPRTTSSWSGDPS